jgi:hypothetical protein
VREADDGRVLVCCRAGCSTPEILDATGCTWADLFAPRNRTDPPSRRRREPLIRPRDALRLLSHEVTICALVAGDLARGEAVSEADRARLLVAANRIARMESLCS